MAQEPFPRLQPSWCSIYSMERVLFIDSLLQPFRRTNNSSSYVRRGNARKEVQIFGVSGLQVSSGKMTGIIEIWVYLIGVARLLPDRACIFCCGVA